MRDTLRPQTLPPPSSRTQLFDLGGGDRLLGRLDLPEESSPNPLALVLLVPGLGGDSEGTGTRRLALALVQAGFAVLRLNLRGAGAGRPLARGSYSARCDADLLPVIAACQLLASSLGPDQRPVPLVGVGISLGGTVLLNVVHGRPQDSAPAFEALVALSSPLDLEDAARRIGQRRNAVYQRWMVRRLLRQVLADPHGPTPAELERLQRLVSRSLSLRGFDAALTAPRWGWQTVDQYYRGASPLQWLLTGGGGVPTLLVHAVNDPWVPVGPHRRLMEHLDAGSPVSVLLSAGGGHNGFHDPWGCWSDRITVGWLRRRLGLS